MFMNPNTIHLLFEPIKHNRSHFFNSQSFLFTTKLTTEDLIMRKLQLMTVERLS